MKRLPRSLLANPGSAIKATKAALLGLAGASSLAWATPGVPGSIDGTWAPLSPYGPGKLITVVSSFSDTASAMAIQVDGKIVLAGYCSNNFCAVRYNTDGSLDSGFGGTGSVLTQVGASSGVANAVTVQPDGKIVLGGWCLLASGVSPSFCAVRYTANGNLDTGFNGSGKVVTPMSGFDKRATAVAMQGDGKIVLAGGCDGSFCAVRYNADGSLDTTFNTSGIVVTQNFGRAYALAIQADGKIVLAGSCANSVSGSCVARYNANGLLDTAFNGTGMRTGVPIGYLQAVAMQPDGKIVLAGGCFGFCAARLHADGSVDTGFNGTGVSDTDLTAGANGAQAVAIQADGRIVLAGFCRDASSHDDFCVLRYNGDGSLDSSFNASNVPLRGTAITPVGSLNDIAYAMAIQADGKIVLAGTCEIPNGSNGLRKFGTVRYEGGPFAAQNCKLDIDGDNRVLATTDSLIHARIARGMTGSAVVAGINFPAEATRKTWPEIRAYLVTQCGMSLPP